MGGRSVPAKRKAHGTGRAAKRRIGGGKRAQKVQAEPAASLIYQLKISLQRSKPLIWRRVLVPGEFELDFVHAVFQYAMGWTFSHFHNFYIDGQYYGAGSQGEELGFLNEQEYQLQDLVTKRKQKFLYEYDFGDDWEHEVVLEKILPRKPNAFYPACMAGAGACPPEDCGGIWGYYSMLEALRDKKHPEHAQYREWIGYDFDPAEFSAQAVSKELARAFKRKPAA